MVFHIERYLALNFVISFALFVYFHFFNYSTLPENTALEVGFAAFIIFVMFIATSYFPNKKKTHGYIILNNMQELISGKTSQRMTAGNYEITSTTKINEQNKMTMKITKATAKLEKENTVKNIIKIFTITPSKDSRTMNVTLPFKTTTMVAGRNKTTLATEKNHQKDTTTLNITEAKTTTIKTTTTKKQNKRTMKKFTITPYRNSLGDHTILKTSIVHPKSTAPSKHFICLNLMGRLGNLMFQYASAYGIARSKGMDVIISENESIAKTFHLNRGGKVVKDTSMCKGVKTIHEVRASAFDKKTIDFSNDENIALDGYLQSYKYFEKVSDEIRRQFTFRESIKKEARKVIQEIFQQHLKKHNNMTQNWTFVAVHVRRGDMLNHPHGYMVAPKEYFHRAQKMFRALKQHVLFVVCSDVTEWCKDNLQSEDTYVVEDSSPEVDMAILSSCNHTISSVGSFSWWSAWLAKGLVTYYCPPARPGSALRTQYSKDFSDYFPSKWIRMQL